MVFPFLNPGTKCGFIFLRVSIWQLDLEKYQIFNEPPFFQLHLEATNHILKYSHLPMHHAANPSIISFYLNPQHRVETAKFPLKSTCWGLQWSNLSHLFQGKSNAIASLFCMLLSIFVILSALSELWSFHQSWKENKATEEYTHFTIFCSLKMEILHIIYLPVPYVITLKC